MSWLSFTARRWFSAALTIARRCDGRAWNVSHTKFLSPISKLQPKSNPASCHFSCVQIEIELSSARNERKTGAEGEGEMRAARLQETERNVGDAIRDRSRASTRTGPPQRASGDREISYADNSSATPRFAVGTPGAEGEGEMTIPRPQQWTEAEVHQLRMLANRKVSADSIAKSLGRYVGSLKTKARELNLILSRRLKVKK